MAQSLDDRILVLMPTKKDNERIVQMFSNAGFSFAVCANMADLCRQIENGAAAALMTEEIVLADRAGSLSNTLAAQPTWSDFPLIVLAREQTGVERLRESINATLVERPVKIRSLLSVLRAALRSRQRQYELRAHLSAQLENEQELKQADRRKDEFLATLAHELRNPLAPLRNSIHLLQLTAAEDDRIATMCEIMERQVNHLVRLVDDLMEISRITRGKIELRKDSVELAAVVRSAVETSRPILDESGVQLSLGLPKNTVVMNGDFIRLSQVFANLLNNAAKYTDSGGHVHFTAKCEESDVVISVRDTGIGIPPEVLPNIFDMFMQVDRSTSRSRGGLGIGLTLVRSLVDLHGGSIRARSDGVGHGSEFVVRLPLAQAQPRQHESSNAPGLPLQLPPRRVLVVDDNVDSAATLGTLLKLLGVEVQIANDGPAALAAMEMHRPDIVLLDLGMPGMDGYEVAKQVRLRPDFAQIKLVALTGWGQAEDRRRTKEAGFDLHFVKPVDITALQSFLMSRS